jgi:glycosyltransferase involved in cell wall biosynthesis
MRVTIVMAARDAAATIRDAIGSALGQTYPCNLAIFDDGSQDGTGDIIQEAVEVGDALYSIRTDTPIGPAAARNNLIQATWDDTDVFAILDADDIYMPSKVERSLEAIKKFPPHVALVYTDEGYLDHVTGKTFTRYRPPYSLPQLAESNIVGGSYLITRNALETVGLFDESFPVAEHTELALRVASKFVLVHVAEPLVQTQVFPQSLRLTAGMPVWAYHTARAKRGKHAPQPS